MGEFAFYIERQAKAIQRQRVLVEADTIDEARSMIEDEFEINAPIEDDNWIKVIDENITLIDYDTDNKDNKVIESLND